MYADQGYLKKWLREQASSQASASKSGISSNMRSSSNATQSFCLSCASLLEFSQVHHRPTIVLESLLKYARIADNLLMTIALPHQPCPVPLAVCPNCCTVKLSNQSLQFFWAGGKDSRQQYCHRRRERYPIPTTPLCRETGLG